MVRLSEARRLALSFPQTTEEDHHGFPSFRVAKKIFATQPDADHFNIMLSSDETDMAVGTAPEACEEVWWGKQLAGVRVRLAAVNRALLAELLRAAWRRKAPRKLVSSFDASDQ